MRVRVGDGAGGSPGHRERRRACGGAAVELLRGGGCDAWRRRSLPSAAADDAAPRASMEKLNAVAEKLKEKKVLVAIGAAAGVVGIALWLRSRRVAA